MNIRDDSNRAAITTSLSGNELLENTLLNKGTAFTQRERLEFGLLGLLPPHIESLQEQVERCFGYEGFFTKSNVAELTRAAGEDERYHHGNVFD